MSPGPEGRTQPALDQLAERLQLNGVTSDPRAVASALLALVRVNGWTDRPEKITSWLLQLALDVAKGP